MSSKSQTQELPHSEYSSVFALGLGLVRLSHSDPRLWTFHFVKTNGQTILITLAVSYEGFKVIKWHPREKNGRLPRAMSGLSSLQYVSSTPDEPVGEHLKGKEAPSPVVACIVARGEAGTFMLTRPYSPRHMQSTAGSKPLLAAVEG